MSAQSAQVIDLQAYRQLRSAQRAPHAPDASQVMMAGAMPMAWVPVWFMPVYFAGTPRTAD